MLRPDQTRIRIPNSNSEEAFLVRQQAKQLRRIRIRNSVVNRQILLLGYLADDKGNIE